MSDLSAYYAAFSRYYTDTAETRRRVRDTIAALKQLVPNLAWDKRMRILDLCSGAGVHGLELARLGHSVLGVDFLPEMVRLASGNVQEGEECAFVTGDVLGYEPSQRFDLVTWFGNSIAHFNVNDMRSVLRRAGSWLEPNGVLVVEYADAMRMLLQYRPVLVEGESAESGGQVFSIHHRYEAERGSIVRTFVDISASKTFDVELYLWSPAIVHGIAQGEGFEPADGENVDHASNIGRREWRVDVFRRRT